MVGRVLRSHDIVEKEDDGYRLIGYGDLDDEQVEHLLELCETKLDEYKKKRGIISTILHNPDPNRPKPSRLRSIADKALP
jgi:hypothetical protein